MKTNNLHIDKYVVYILYRGFFTVLQFPPVVLFMVFTTFVYLIVSKPIVKALGSCYRNTPDSRSWDRSDAGRRKVSFIGMRVRENFV